MASMTPVLTREQKRLIKSGTLTKKQIERMKNSATTWRFEQPAGTDRDGKRIRHTDTFHGSKREAKKALANFEAYWGSRKITDRTLGGYIEEYLERKQGTIAESSYYTLERKMEVVKYLWGENTRLSQITPVVIDDKCDELFTKGGPRRHPCKASYVAEIKGALSGVLSDAVRHHALVVNPIPFTTQGRYKQKADKREIPPTKSLLAVMRNLDVRNPFDMAIMLALTLGLRRQEAAALQWDDISYEENIIHVRRSVRVGRDGEWVEETTKTEAGLRDLPMPEFLPGMLARRRQTLNDDLEFALRSKRIAEYPSELFVCSNHLGERPSLSSITHYWGARRAGWQVPCSFHDLRHCYISCLSQANVPVVTAAALAGHANPSTTLDIYSHTDWDSIVEAVESVSGLFEDGLVEYPSPKIVPEEE